MLYRRRRQYPDRLKRLAGVELHLYIQTKLGAVEVIGPQPNTLGVLIFGPEVEARILLENVLTDRFLSVGVGAVLCLYRPCVVDVPFDAPERRGWPTEPLVIGWLAPRTARDETGPVAPERRADRARTAQSAPAKSGRDIDAAGKPGTVERLACDNIFPRIDPGSCEVLQADCDRRKEPVFLFDQVPQIEAAVAVGTEPGKVQVFDPDVTKACR